MIDYFEKFPRIEYPYNVNTLDSSIIKTMIDTPDLSIRFKIIEEFITNSSTTYDYYWTDYDRLDIIADKYYGDADLSWLVMLSAGIYDWLYDLPLNEAVFDNYLKSKYKVTDTSVLRNTVHHYEDIAGVIIDKETYQLMADYNKVEVMVYDYEEKFNHKKRNIKLISKKYVKPILNEFETRIQHIKNNRRLYDI